MFDKLRLPCAGGRSLPSFSLTGGVPGSDPLSLPEILEAGELAGVPVAGLGQWGWSVLGLGVSTGRSETRAIRGGASPPPVQPSCSL